MHVGVNLNNREALIAPDYGVPELLDLGASAERLGFDSLWVGDSLLSKPRYEPLALLAALSQRTTSVRLGTACLVTTLRNPVQLAQAWATLDVLSNGRAILGACSGNILESAVKREFEVCGLDHRKRMAIFEEGLAVLRALLAEGRVSFAGEHFELDDGFSTGMERAPLLPIQQPPPIWVVSNPSIGASEAKGVSRAAQRVARLGDGWMTCCRASHPEEVAGFVSELAAARAEAGGGSADGFSVAYQVTIALGDTVEAARRSQREYIDAYYPGFSDAVELADWGPAGTADEVAEWLRTFADAGVTTFICRFASLDQPGQLERMAADVLPVVRPR